MPEPNAETSEQPALSDNGACICVNASVMINVKDSRKCDNREGAGEDKRLLLRLTAGGYPPAERYSSHDDADGVTPCLL